MKSKFFYFLFLSLFIISCGQSNKEEIKRLQAENDSLQNQKLQLEDELIDYFSTLYDIQKNIEKIKEAQNVIPIHPLSENTPDDVKKRVKTDISFINELIEANRSELDKLRNNLKSNNVNIDKLNKTIDGLVKQLDEESAKVLKLQKQLVAKDSVIANLGNTVKEMGEDIDNLSEINKMSEELILLQDEKLNTAWYAIGTKRELKDNNIITSEGLFSQKKIMQTDFNKNYFVKIDTRETKKIPLYSKSKPKVLTNHPSESYNITLEDNSYFINILDEVNFWSISKYLVVEI